MTTPARIVSRDKLKKTITSQQSPIPGRESQMKRNRAGGYVFKTEDLEQVRRFLILGSPTTYYAGETEMTLENASAAIRVIQSGHILDLLKLVEEVNTAQVNAGEGEGGEDEYRAAAAAKKTYSLFVLALAQLYADDGLVSDERAEVYNVIRRRNVVSTLRQMFDYLNNLYLLTDRSNSKGKVIPFGSGFKRAIRDWMLGSGLSQGKAGSDIRWLAMQFAKYRSANYRLDKSAYDDSDAKQHKITARDVLRMAHIKPRDVIEDNLFAWATKRQTMLDAGKDIATQLREVNVTLASTGEGKSSDALDYLAAFEEAQATDNPRRIVQLIHEFGLTWEMIPNTWFKGEGNTDTRDAIWRALLGLPAFDSIPATYPDGNVRWKMGLTAMLRNTARLASYGLLTAMNNDVTKFYVEQIAGTKAVERLIRARVHPVTLLNTLKIYQRGYTEREKPVKGLYGRGVTMQMSRDLTWTPNRKVAEALESAFYDSFGSIPMIENSIFYAIDVSGSMGSGQVTGVPALTPRDAAAVMAMVSARRAKNSLIMGFSDGSTTGRGYGLSFANAELVTIPIYSNTSIADAISIMERIPMGGTDCALPFIWAEKTKTDVDCFVVLTDNESWSGRIHPSQALAHYRVARNLESRVVCVALTANDAKINDPQDKLALDVVGMDATAPQIISDFAAGRI